MLFKKKTNKLILDGSRVQLYYWQLLFRQVGILDRTIKKANYECVKLITNNLYLTHGFNNRKYVENIIK